MIAEHEAGYYVMSCFDVNNFKTINDQYGVGEGDRILRYIGKAMLEDMNAANGIGCRISGDNFAALYPVKIEDRGNISDGYIERIKQRPDAPEILLTSTAFSVGRYIVNDLSLSATTLYDRAYLAKQSIKGRYDKHVAYFDDAMRDDFILEQHIIAEMDTALAQRQFEPWFQPQYNHSTGALIGAEALVRWRHPTKGLISPGIFIPIFERNGFVYELDKYIWEETCRYLRKWTDEGRNPLPVSVNISRYDIFRADIVEVITGLVQKYSLPVELLRLEVTESAFSKSANQIIAVVKRLIDAGFTVEIDDFGSGYSSLNTLKDVPAQVLKLDMKFLESNSNSQRGGNIVEPIVRMAKWLDMSAIAEGVETLEQADFLLSIGCNYIQGYLYARPMPAADYEAHCKGAGKEERLLALETVENLDNDSFWDPKSMDTFIFNSFVGAACIYEYCDGNIELIRATEKYAQVIGSAGMTVEDALRLNWTEHLDKNCRERLINDLNESVAMRKEVTGEYVFVDLPGCPHETYLRSTMRVIASTGKRYLVYCTNENITAQRKAERKEHETAEEMRLIMDNVGQGITASVVQNGKARFLFANEKYFELLGYTREQYEAEIKDPFLTIAPEDRERVSQITDKVTRTEKAVLLEYRAVRRDGSKPWFMTTVSTGRFEGIKEPVQLSIFRDITEEKKAEQEMRDTIAFLHTMMDDMPGGFCRVRLHAGEPAKIVYCNDGFCTLVGMSRERAI